MDNDTIVGSNFTTNSSLCFWNETWGNSSLFNLSFCDWNDTGNATDTAPHVLPYPLWLTIILGTLASIVSVMTILGNAVVLLGFAMERSIRQPTNYFIASLAVSDLLIGSFSMPFFTLYLLLGYWPLGPWLCDIWLSLDWTVCLTSQYTVFFITVDRFFSVKIPAKYRNWRTERKVLIMVAITWIIPTLVFFTSIIGWQFFVGVRTVGHQECQVQFMNDPLFTFLLTIGYYWTTLTVMCGLYGGIYKVALKLQKKAEAKQKKMNSAMQMTGGDKKNETKEVRNPAEEAAKKLLRKRKKGPRGTSTTSFSSDKERDEERSSSPAFASDEEDNSSSQTYNQPKNKPEVIIKSSNNKSKKFNKDKKVEEEKLQNHVSCDTGFHEQSVSDDTGKLIPSDSDKLKVSEEQLCKGFDNVMSDSLPSADPSSPSAFEADVMKGCRFIDEDSLKSLASAENVKLLAEAKPENAVGESTEASSPVWKKRFPEPPSYDELSVNRQTTDSGFYSGTHDKATQINDNELPVKKPTLQKSVSHCLDVESEEARNILSRVESPLKSFVKSMRQRNNSKRQPPVRQKKSKSENRARKALRTITFILGAFVLCWTPYHIMVFIIGICGGYSCVNTQFYNFTYWLCYLNSPINPFCYAFANVQFKRAFIRVLKLDWHRT